MTADPHELRNLAKSPADETNLKRLRQALEQWQKETHDLGSVPESELRERMRPGGIWARVSKPKMTASPASDHSSSATISLTTDTAGASIAYTTEEGEKARWKLYGGQITLDRPARLRAKACRLGFLDSEEVSQRFE